MYQTVFHKEYGKKQKIWRSVVALVAVFQLGLAFLTVVPAKTYAAGQDKWTDLLDKYRNKRSTDRLIFVKYTGGTNCRVVMYEKTRRKNRTYRWKRLLTCKGYVGKNGIDKQREGDKRTPTGTFLIGEAFGILDDPGSGVPYTKVTDNLYWSGEWGTYNTMVDSGELGHVPANSEHLVDYDPNYHYALDIGYNRKCNWGKGSAIFLHCFGSNPYTAGCVSVSEENMIFILQNITKKTRICIYPKT